MYIQEQTFRHDLSSRQRQAFLLLLMNIYSQSHWWNWTPWIWVSTHLGNRWVLVRLDSHIIVVEGDSQSPLWTSQQQVFWVPSKDWIPSFTLLTNICFEFSKVCVSVLFHINFELALTSSWNGWVIGLIEYAQTTWLMSPNHDRAPVVSDG